MSAVGDLLELMHGASRSCDSVRSSWRAWHHDERGRAAMAAHARRAAGKTWGIPRGGGEPPPAEHEELLRFWWQRPDRMREEHLSGSRRGPELVVQVGATWWAYSEHSGALSNDGDPSHGHGIGQRFEAVLDPASVMGLLEFEITGASARAGRAVVEARAQPRPARRADRHGFALHALGLGADDYALQIDAERGTILRVEARLDGLPFSVLEATEIAFDEELDPALFVFTAPAGEELRSADIRHRRRSHPALHEAVREAPFTVYAPTSVPRDWDLHVNLFLGSERPPAPPSVQLSYRSRDAGAGVSIGQTPAGSPDRHEIAGGEEIRRDGRTMRFRERTRDWRQAQLTTVLGDTALWLTSETLAATDLVALALALQPASADVPRLQDD